MSRRGKHVFSDFKFESSELINCVVKKIENLSHSSHLQLVAESVTIGYFQNIAITINAFSIQEIKRKHSEFSFINLAVTAQQYEIGILIEPEEINTKEKINLIKYAQEGYFVIGANRYNGYGIVTFFEMYPWNRKTKNYLNSLLKRGSLFTFGGAADPSSSPSPKVGP